MPYDDEFDGFEIDETTKGEINVLDEGIDSSFTFEEIGVRPQTKSMLDIRKFSLR